MKRRNDSRSPVVLHTDMMSVLNEHSAYFMARHAEGRSAPVFQLHAEGMEGWTKGASPRCVSASGPYDVMITPRRATCSCKAFAYSEEGARTCKHVQALLMVLWDGGFRFVQ